MVDVGKEERERMKRGRKEVRENKERGKGWVGGREEKFFFFVIISNKYC